MHHDIYTADCCFANQSKGVEITIKVMVTSFLCVKTSWCRNSSPQSSRYYLRTRFFNCFHLLAQTPLPVSATASEHRRMLQLITQGNLQLCSLLWATAARHRISTEISIAVITFPFHTLTHSTGSSKRVCESHTLSLVIIAQYLFSYWWNSPLALAASFDSDRNSVLEVLQVLQRISNVSQLACEFLVCLVGACGLKVCLSRESRLHVYYKTPSVC